MSEQPDLRTRAARLARQADKEADAKEANRLMSIAEYWVRLAEIEDWERDDHGQDEPSLVPGQGMNVPVRDR